MKEKKKMYLIESEQLNLYGRVSRKTIGEEREREGNEPLWGFRGILAFKTKKAAKAKIKEMKSDDKKKYAGEMEYSPTYKIKEVQA